MSIKSDGITSLLPRHFKIVDLAVKGLTAKQIADQLNIGQPQVSVILNSPTFKHEFALRRAMYEEKTTQEQVDGEDEIVKTLKEGARAAAEKLVGHIESPESSISLRSCTEILDRTGYAKKPDQTVINTGATIILASDDASRIVDSIEMDSEDEPTASMESSDTRPPVNSQPKIKVSSSNLSAPVDLGSNGGQKV